MNKTVAQIRTMGSGAAAKMVANKVYGSGHLVKDVMTENSLMSWQEVVDDTLGRTWMGKLHVDALARVHDVVSDMGSPISWECSEFLARVRPLRLSVGCCEKVSS